MNSAIARILRGGWRSGLVGVMAAANLLADGLIIVHEPVPLPLPGPVLPPPGPRPPWPRPIPSPPVRPYPFAPLDVVWHRVEARVRDQVATTAVDQEFYNPNDRQLEGTYLFPVPRGAQIDKFSMDVNGQSVDAELLAADKAREIYEEIVRKHRDPALLEYVGRDVFKVRIFPIEPRSRKRVRLSYTQLLPADSGLVSYVYPLNTERFSARPISTVSLKIDLESKRPLKSIYSPSHAVEIRRSGERQATIGFEAKDVRPDTDFQLLYSTDPGELTANLLTHKAGADDGYFLLLAAPAFAARDRKAVPKDVAFVLDTSGSMAGKKLEQAKRALRFCIENLNESDRFEVIRFATDIEPVFDGLVDATAAHRDRAASFVDGLKAIGGTAIHDALLRALKARPAGAARPYFIIFLTDGLPTVGVVDNDAIVAAVKNSGGAATRIFCFGIGHDVNTHLLDRITETTRATSAYVLPEEDLEVKLSSFFTKIKDPVLADLKLTFPKGVRVTRLYPAPIPDLFSGEQLVLAGRYSGDAEGSLELEGSVAGETQRFTYNVAFAAHAADHEFIPRLWATRRVGYLLDEIRLRGDQAELRDEVVQLARQYGIVTPYTAYLIHEDEQRRGVPLAQQSLPQLQADPAAWGAMKANYTAFTNQVSGQAAVAAARYGLAQRSANQAADALALSRQEANRALMATAPTPVRAPGSGIGGVVAGPGAVPAAAASPATAEVVRNIDAYTQQARFVAGRNFFLNGNQWVDATVQSLQKPATVRIQFNSAEYFELARKHPETRPWLALGQNLQFALGQTVYEIYE